MTFTLRPYQEAAINGLYEYWSTGRGDNPLIVAPTGAGKSAILGKIIMDAMSFPGTKVMVLTHVREILEQNAKALLRIYPQADIGFYSASIGQKRLDKPIIFAGIQSVYQRAYDMVPAPDLVIVDESHMIPKNSETRYGKFLSDLKTCNPKVKMIGLTATPYRLDSGYLHKGRGALFDGIAYDIPVGMLMDEGYLSPVISKGGAKKIDLTNVGKRGGEFIESELAIAASDPELVKATVKEIVEYGQDRKAWLVFASGLGHAQMLREEMETYGVSVEVVSGDDPMKDRDRKIARFKSGQVRAIVNCGVLTTGFDHPDVDLVAIVRATESTGLYIQIVGRGTRPVYAHGYDLSTKEGRLSAINNGTKPNCLILDYGENVFRHGFIDAVKPKIKGESTGAGDAPTKECPSCNSMVFAGLRVCGDCGHEFPPPELNHNHKSYSGAILSTQVQDEWIDVDDVTYERWKKEGKPDSIRVTYVCGMTRISEWLCPDHGGYAASRYQARMPALKAQAMTTGDALSESENWIKPSRIKVRPDGKYHQIIQLDYSGRKENEKSNFDKSKEQEWERYADEFI
jgi:DNA repair protein RadD